MATFRYTHAIVCRIPNSFQTEALNINGKIDLKLARKQHENYVQILRGIGLDVIELPPDESYPDCVFVEDTAIVCNGSAFLCNPGSSSRKGEVDYMRNIFKNELDIPVIEIKDENCIIDGGDVLFTGKEFFVGLSGRTNEGGAAALANAFPEFPCSPVKVEKTFHLKSMLSMVTPNVICVSDNADSQLALKRIEQVATCRYQTLTVPDINAANTVFVNGTLLYRSGFPATGKILESKLSHLNLKAIDVDEIAKAFGCLTCLSILIRKPKHIKTIM